MNDSAGRVPTDLGDLDLGALVGVTVEEARAVVESVGGTFRAIGSDDQQGLPIGITLDLNRRRVTVVVTSGRVVRVLGPG